MSRKEKMLEKLKNNPRNISEHEFKSALKMYGFILNSKKGKGGHQVYRHSKLPISIIPQRTVNFTKPMRLHIIKNLIQDIEEVINDENSR